MQRIAGSTVDTMTGSGKEMIASINLMNDLSILLTFQYAVAKNFNIRIV